ncbi:SDR family oxidoreductase [Gluconacetobacter aggeris]|uniref:SDR family oxidoreductase n=1 Tax=Gluconacetobacter aggeris TaxID=1286186 RepID=UPI001C8262AD|nr:SDR family oxidoreductase [Gluconacetobacter aggeris]
MDKANARVPLKKMPCIQAGLLAAGTEKSAPSTACGRAPGGCARAVAINLSTSIIGAWLPAHGTYVATKAAIEATTHTLAKELGPRGITVNAVAPGPIATELLLAMRDAAAVRALAATIPLGRIGAPPDVAQVVSFLAGPDGGWVNGQVIKVNGGRN